jgi:Transposase DDE domain
MDATTLAREWGVITGLLPDEWQELARETGALQRARQVRDPGTLLFLILLHVASGLSLRQAAARARVMGLAEISDVALMKRLRGSERWLHALAARMYVSSPFYSPPSGAPPARRIRVVDATNVTEPGSTGTDWRIHYVLQLPSLECDFFEVTDVSGGESFSRFPVRTGDVILGDRGYAQREGVATVRRSGGDVVVRLNASNFPLLQDGRRFDLLPALRTLEQYEPGEWRVEFDALEERHAARVCAIRKSEEAAQRAKKQVLKAAAKMRRQPRPETLEFAEYIVVLTTIGAETASTAQVLELYRSRWQVELAFKRIKTLLGAGHVPKTDPESARAWIYGKLLAVLLIERLLQEARFFSPWGFRFART